MVWFSSCRRSVFHCAACLLLGIICLQCVAASQVFAARKKVASDLFSVSFPTEQEGFACGRVGTIVHTSDGGSTWKRQQSGTEYTLTSISFVDAQKGWAVGFEGTILHTKDGGNTWSKQKSPEKIHLMAVYFVNSKKGWAVGEKTNILYTEDGGESWKIQFTDKDFILKSISFCDENNGWTVGEFGFIYHTDNGGKTWKQQGGEFKFSEETGDMEGGTFLFHVRAVDPRTAWVVGIGGHVAKTTDSGNSWQTPAKDVPKAHLFSIIQNNNGSLFIAGNGVLMSSSDSGKTFEYVKAEPAPIYGWLYGIGLRGKAGLVAVGKEGWIYTSDPRGASWRMSNH